MSREDIPVLVILAILFIQPVAMYFYQPKSVTVKYNCDIAEISPDIPLKVKEDCRKLKSGRI